MRQGFGQLVDDRLVDFRVLAFGNEADLLADHVGNFANDTRHALEDRLHRLRTDRHDAVLDFARQLLEFVETHVDGRRAARIVFDDALRQHRLIDDKLADEVDQAVNTVEIDTDGLAGACIGRGIGIRLRCGRRCRSLTLSMAALTLWAICVVATAASTTAAT